MVRDSYRALPVYVVTLGSRQPEMSEKLRELQQGLTEGGVDLFRRQVRKLGINALKALASELELSVEGSRLKEEFASPVCAKIEVQESVTRLRCVVQSGGTKGLWTQLKALKVEDLRVIAQEIGLPSSGVRDAVMKRLFDDISAQESGTTGRPLPSSSSRRPELPEAGNDEQPPRRGCITEGVSVDLVGAVVWIGVFVSCGLGTECYRDISIDCCAAYLVIDEFCVCWQSSFHELCYVTSRARVHHNFRAYGVAGAWRCGRQYFGTGGRASYGRQQQRTHVAAREDGEHDAGCPAEGCSSFWCFYAWRRWFNGGSG